MKLIDATAKVEQVLLWYDQAEIVLLKINPLEYILAVSSGHANDSNDMYVGASMTLAFLADYQDGKFDLRYALAHANLRRYWSFSYDGQLEKVTITRLKRTSDTVISSLPDTGFFSREHHAIDTVKKFIPDTAETFDIDGSWELGEFSQFYGQVEDIYYIFNDIRRFNDSATNSKVKAAISQALDRPWRGGGSYVGYYDKIANDNAPTAKLKVSGIKYNSPGYVSVRAKKKPFEDMVALLQSYAHNINSMRKAHSALYRFMSANKLLSSDAKKFVNAASRASISTHAARLDAYMPGDAYQTFLKMSEGSEVVAAKILLSMFRRMERLYRYFEQGRVKYHGLETDPIADDDESLTVI